MERRSREPYTQWVSQDQNVALIGSSPKGSGVLSDKRQVVRQLLAREKRLSQLCREHELSATLIRRWKEQYAQRGEAAWPELGDWVVSPDAEQRIKELEAALGRAHLENELLRRALKQAEKGGSLPRRNGKC